jgi:hypothetical protein
MTHHSQTCRSRMGHRPITQGKRVLRALLIAATMPSLMGLTRPAMAQAPVRFQVLDAADFAPDVVLPPPPVAGSIEEKADLMAVHRLVESARQTARRRRRKMPRMKTRRSSMGPRASGWRIFRRPGPC